MIRIELTITCSTPLNIGSGAQQGTFADRALTKDDEGWPYIPATALKGRLRHTVEQIATGVNLQPPICRTHQKMCRDTSNPCPVCAIFGSPWIAGRLRFVDLLLSKPDFLRQMREERRMRHPPTHVRYGVAINRRRGVAEDQLLYTTELFEPGMDLGFEGELTGKITRRQAALVVAGLRWVPAVGRGKSGGLGWTTVETKVYEGDKYLEDSVLRKELGL
jgi:CRISPR/Cas system CSM-associated protein Csm3 (group 7 of RAMP superfamily)